MRVRRFTNPAQEFLRLIPSDVGRKITDIRLNITVDNLEKDLSSAINDLKTVRIEINAKDNLWYHLRIKPYISEDKKIEGAVITIIDITDIKKAQENLVFQGNLLDNVRDAVLAIDSNATITYWSKSAEELFGWSAKEAIGQPYVKLLQSSDSKVSEVQESKEFLEKLLRNAQSKGEAQYRLKNGVPIIVEVATTVIRGKKSERKDIVISLRDITERKKLESKLEVYAKDLERLIEQRTKQLRDAERMAAIGATAGMVGHDIRNPLQAIVSDIYLLSSTVASVQDNEARNEGEESLESIRKNVDYINKIVQDLQDYSKTIIPASKKVNFEDICKATMQECAIPDNIIASCKIEDSVRIIASDPDLIKRILTNLVSNAIHAMPNGGKLQVSAYKEDSDIVIAVEDTGVGIPEENRTKLFTPLFTTRSKGQGFGLAVIKRMAEALGGSVTFESEVGKGTKFTVRLPPPKGKR